jgi:hypothetical protein
MMSHDIRPLRVLDPKVLFYLWNTVRSTLSFCFSEMFIVVWDDIANENLSCFIIQ